MSEICYILISIDDYGDVSNDGQESKKFDSQNLMISNEENDNVCTDGKESKTSDS